MQGVLWPLCGVLMLVFWSVGAQAQSKPKGGTQEGAPPGQGAQPRQAPQTPPAPQAAPSPPAHVDLVKPGEWYRVPNSKLADRAKKPHEYPDYDAATQHSKHYEAVRATTGIHGVTSAWSSAGFDTKRQRLLVWGGGHADYAGNEVYAFDLNTLAWTRLSDPWPLTDSQSLIAKTGEYPDARGRPLPSQPRSAHTYNYLQYIPALDSLCALGRSAIYPNSEPPDEGGPWEGAAKVHCFDCATNTWSLRPTRIWDMKKGPIKFIGAYSAVDPKTGFAWVHSTTYAPSALFQWNPMTDTWTQRTTAYHSYTYNQTASIDAQSRLVATGVSETGPSTMLIDLKGSGMLKPVPLTTQGDKTLEGCTAPGFVFVPKLEKFVGWCGGNAVYVLDPATWTWSKVMPAPRNTVVPLAPEASGTYGRWRYSEAKDVFILANSATQDVLLYRLP